MTAAVISGIFRQPDRIWENVEHISISLLVFKCAYLDFSFPMQILFLLLFCKTEI